MDLAHILTEEEVSPSRLVEALDSIEGLRGTIDLTPGPILTSAEVLEPLQESLKQVEGEVANFLNAFPPTAKAVTKEKKAAFVIFSPDLGEIKKEFRLPCGTEVKESEGKRASEAWISFKLAYTNTASTLLRTTVEMQKASSNDVPSTVEWEEEEMNDVSAAVKLTTDRLLLVGMLVKHIYSLVFAKAQLEFAHKPYEDAFGALKNHRLNRRLKVLRRQAGSSSKIRKEALAMLEREERL